MPGGPGDFIVLLRDNEQAGPAKTDVLTLTITSGAYAGYCNTGTLQGGANHATDALTRRSQNQIGSWRRMGRRRACAGSCLRLWLLSPKSSCPNATGFQYGGNKVALARRGALSVMSPALIPPRFLPRHFCQRTTATLPLPSRLRGWSTSCGGTLAHVRPSP